MFEMTEAEFEETERAEALKHDDKLRELRERKAAYKILSSSVWSENIDGGVQTRNIKASVL